MNCAQATDSCFSVVKTEGSVLRGSHFFSEGLKEDISPLALGGPTILFFFKAEGVLLFLFIYLCIYFWLCWVFVAARGLSLVAVSGGYSSLRCAGFSLLWLLLLRSTGSRRAGFSSCGSRALECRLMWHMGFAAPRHVGSSRTRDRTCVSCIGRWILNHCTAREIPGPQFLKGLGSDLVT